MTRCIFSAITFLLLFLLGLYAALYFLDIFIFSLHQVIHLVLRSFYLSLLFIFHNKFHIFWIFFSLPYYSISICIIRVFLHSCLIDVYFLGLLSNSFIYLESFLFFLIFYAKRINLFISTKVFKLKFLVNLE